VCVFFWFSLDYFVIVFFAFVVLALVSSVLCQEIGWEERLEIDLFCVKWDVEPELKMCENSALKSVFWVSTSCRNVGCKTFVFLLDPTRSCNYITAQRLFNQLHENYITISWPVHLQTCTESLVKICPKPWEICTNVTRHRVGTSTRWYSVFGAMLL